MRAVFIGTSGLAVSTADLFVKGGHEVVMIEQNRARIEELSDTLDCGFLNGDGTKPTILREASPDRTDILFCLTDNDQANILASLVGRSVGYKRVITRIEDVEYRHICTELSLNDTIIPDEAVARLLADLSHGVEPLTLTAFLKYKARFYSFFVRETDAGPVDDLALPESTRIVCVYRGERFHLPEQLAKLKEGDEVLLVTDEGQLSTLAERWGGTREAKLAGD
ncbi:MAG: TrkA family potassium uptake protein [Alphaproteobacteria bacterium]|jgi:trk system potassium uptake protein TrkA|nr:TrkA family potassium uptake protein [Alphaproteobacteria bacterium]